MRILSKDRENGLIKVERQEAEPEPSGIAKAILSFLEKLPQMISAAVKPPVVNVAAPNVAPIVHVETPKAEVKVSHPPIYVNVPEIKVPQAPAINMPEGRAPVVNVEPTINLTVRRPNKWLFTFYRDEYGRMTTAECEDISDKE
jgi:hypothetical protein